MRTKGEQRGKTFLVYSLFLPLYLTVSFPFFHTTSNFCFSVSCPSPMLYQYHTLSFTSAFPLCTSFCFPLSSLYSCFLSFFSSQFKASPTAGASRRFSVCGKKRQGGSQETFLFTVVEYHSLNSKYGLL